MTSSKQEHIEFCQAILGKVQVILDDSPEVRKKANRTALADGGCDGYYEVLMNYDPETDMFDGRIPASKVERVAFFDALDKVIEKAHEVFGTPPQTT